MLRLHPTGYAQHERALKPLVLSPSSGSGQATRSEVEGRTESFCSPSQIKKDLYIARRSVFAVANIVLILATDEYLPNEKVQPLLSELEEQSRMLLACRRRLKS